jgi:hypothetical protein
MTDFLKVNDRKVQYLGVIAAITTVFPAIAFAFLVALNFFWWCPEGGCSLAAWADKVRVLGNITGLLALILVFSLALQFPFVLITRMFCAKKTIEDTFLRVTFPLFGWYDLLMRKWVNFLWRT